MIPSVGQYENAFSPIFSAKPMTTWTLAVGVCHPSCASQSWIHILGIESYLWSLPTAGCRFPMVFHDCPAIDAGASCLYLDHHCSRNHVGSHWPPWGHEDSVRCDLHHWMLPHHHAALAGQHMVSTQRACAEHRFLLPGQCVHPHHRRNCLCLSIASSFSHLHFLSIPSLPSSFVGRFSLRIAFFS